MFHVKHCLTFVPETPFLPIKFNERNTMNRFYFNTGVRPETIPNSSFPYEYHREKGNVIRGTLLIPYDCDAPLDAEPMFLCDTPNLDEAKSPNVKIFEVKGGNMLSKYAYFRVKNA